MELGAAEEMRPWQDSNLESLLRVTAREGVQEAMPYLLGHRVKRREVGKKSDLGRIRACICWFKSVAPTQRASASRLCQNGRRIQCLIHSATGSNAGSRKTTLAGLEPAVLVKIQLMLVVICQCLIHSATGSNVDGANALCVS